MTAALDIDDFPAFFEAVRGHYPFPWQTRLARRIDEDDIWPELLDLPTGSGKTAVLDIAVFLMALDAVRGTSRMPRRAVLVVDRRVVVDQVAVAGEALADALRQPPAGSVVAGVAAALRGLSGTDSALVCGTLRGGIVRDETWARRPDVPALLSATVDQVGSRLLFRGYGVSDSMRPIHAGLLGTDTLVLLDEVHLSQPFAQTLRAIAQRYQTAGTKPLPSRWHVVEMSATPGADATEAFALDAATDLDPIASPVLRRRVIASKPAELVSVRSRAGDRGPLAKASARAALGLLSQPHVRTVVVVVNRVETARLVERQLRERHAVETLLLTGRMRPIDRDEVVGKHVERLRTRASRHDRDDGTPLVCVGTQCIEAGADFDFDALVTECASLDALRQRFGRVDRGGVLSEDRTPAPGVILASQPDVAEAADDPVYGTSLGATWRWLSGLGSVDFGTSQLERPGMTTLQTLLAPRDDAPVLFPAHLDAWVQTSPRPEPDPDVSLWLHGMRPASTDVHVIWRADLSEGFLAGALAGDERARRTRHTAVIALLSACPPGSGEAVAVPIGAVRRWLADEHEDEDGVADVEGSALREDGGSPPRGGRPFVRWRGDETIVRPAGSALAPGDVVVVPATYGGLAHHSWDPAAKEAVPDLGHEVQLRQRSRVVLRLNPVLGWPVGVPLPGGEDQDEPDDAVARQWLEDHLDDLEGTSQEVAELLLAARRRRLHVQRVIGPADVGQQNSTVAGLRDGTSEYFVCSAYMPRTTRRQLGGDTDSEPATSVFSGPQEVLLDEHLKGVGQVAEQMARSCGLPDELVEDLALAGRLHDLGKSDPRFQRLLHGGDEFAHANAVNLLAKSGLPRTDYRRRQMARRRSGYPSGARHEVLSVALARDGGTIGRLAHDPDLVLHLIASHHGYCRPFVPVAPDPSPLAFYAAVDGRPREVMTDHGLERLDAGVPDRFWRMVEQYGWFRLAWMEAILRLADHRRSETEQDGTERP